MDYAGFYINLDRSVGRRSEIETQLEQFQLQDVYQRFAAVDGSSLDVPANGLKKGEIGCFLSHYFLLQQNLGSPHHLHVIEDDVLLSGYVSKVLGGVLRSGLIDAYDIIFTDTFIPLANNFLKEYKSYYDAHVVRDNSGAIKDFKFNLIDLKDKLFATTASFLVNRNSIAKLHALYGQEIKDGVRLPIDLFIREKTHQGSIKSGCIFPFITSLRLEHSIDSTITERYEGHSVLASNIARQSFFVACDWSKCQEYIAKYLAPPQDLHQQVLTDVLSFSITDKYRTF